ncbi:MAG: MBL fold metallo-hydrolase [Gemmatimonadaceae bacterium]
MSRPAWCANLPRPVYATLERVNVPTDWFQVYRVGDGVYAIYEPHQFQEVISYLILGSTRALLFDTGLGIGNIRAVVKHLTALPIVVLNSHTHYDHTGGNAAFDSVLAVNAPYTRENSLGFRHELVKGEVAPEAFCAATPAGFEPSKYAVKKWTPTQLISDNEQIDLGGRRLRVLQVPGHTPDATALLDSTAGYLWTGDSFYEGPIWLFVDETDWAAYARSVDRMAALVPSLTRLFPSHNVATSDPKLLLQLQGAVQEVRSGQAKPTQGNGEQVTFDFGAFSFLTSKRALAGPSPDAVGGSGLSTPK